MFFEHIQKQQQQQISIQIRIRPHHVAQEQEKSKPKSSCTLFALPQRLISEPKIQCNARVVIVGSSDTGLAALETLSYLPDTNFSKLILVSSSGMTKGTRDESTDLKDILSPYSSYSEREISQLRLDISAHVVNDKVVSIDRQTKTLRTSQNHDLSYDILILATGLQDSTEAQLQDQFRKNVHDNTAFDENTSLNTATFHVPQSVCFLTDTKAETKALNILKDIASEETQQIVVYVYFVRLTFLPLLKRFFFLTQRNRYGSSISALSLIECALKLGVSSKRIVWINPRSNGKILEKSCSDDKTEEFVSSLLERLEVNVRFGLILTNLEVEGQEATTSSVFAMSSKGKSELKACIFQSTSDGKSRDLGSPLLRTLMEPTWIREQHADKMNQVKKREVRIPCSVLLCASEGAVDADIARAVKECGLVFDGSRIVVDHQFRTLDPCIYATGSSSRFSRRFRPKIETSNSNSREIGVATANSVLEAIEPMLETRNAYVLSIEFLLMLILMRRSSQETHTQSNTEIQIRCCSSSPSS